jgi:hypothetical protein
MEKAGVRLVARVEGVGTPQSQPMMALAARILLAHNTIRRGSQTYGE